MSKFCTKCGTQLKDDVNFCVACGTNLSENAQHFNNQQINQNVNVASNVNMQTKISKREIVLSIILTFITCGIYGIYWFIVMTDDANKVNNENGTSGGMAFLFTLLTCGIYSIYWNYKMGQRLYEAGQKHGKAISDNSVLYLVLTFLGLGIVNYCLIQSDLNKFAE